MKSVTRAVPFCIDGTDMGLGFICRQERYDFVSIRHD